MIYHSAVRILLFAVLSALIVAGVAAQDAPVSNLVDACIEDGAFDPNIDYFPNKLETQFTEGFSVEYFNSYKILSVTRPWHGADTAIRYALVQCGAPAPEDLGDAEIIQVPVAEFATMSTTYLPYVEIYGLTDRLIGVDTLSTVSTPAVVERAADGAITELAPNFELDSEVAVELDPDLVITYGFGFDTDDYHLLQDAGLQVALNGEFTESSPLARAEWGKFIALFFNKEAEAEAAFSEVVAEYNNLAALAESADSAPSVFVNSPFDGTWYMAGGASYLARFMQDAGADYLWSDDEGTGALFLDFEAVFERAADADFWLHGSMFWQTADDALAEDERYGDFEALAQGNVWINNLRVNENFGNDYFESGVAYPNRILADFIAIFHPDLLPDHEFYYHQPLGAASD